MFNVKNIPLQNIYSSYKKNKWVVVYKENVISWLSESFHILSVRLKFTINAMLDYNLKVGLRKVVEQWINWILHYKNLWE